MTPKTTHTHMLIMDIILLFLTNNKVIILISTRLGPIFKFSNCFCLCKERVSRIGYSRWLFVSSAYIVNHNRLLKAAHTRSIILSNIIVNTLNWQLNWSCMSYIDDLHNCIEKIKFCLIFYLNCAIFSFLTGFKDQNEPISAIKLSIILTCVWATSNCQLYCATRLAQYNWSCMGRFSWKSAK